MATLLISKPGLTSASALSIPQDWSMSWFRSFISNQLKGADVRNAVGSGGIVVSGTIASPYATIGFGAPVTLPGPVTITAPASGNSLTVYGAPNASVITAISGNSATAGVSDINVERAGSTANAVGEGPSIQLYDTLNGTATILQNSGGQTELWQYNSAVWHQVLKVSSARDITINTPASGTALTINGFSASATLTVASGSSPTAAVGDLTVTRSGSTINTVGAGPCIALDDITNSTFTLLQNSGGQTELWQYNGGWNQILRAVTTRGVVINAPASGSALSVFGVAASPPLTVTPGGTGTTNAAIYVPNTGTGATPVLFVGSNYFSTGTATPTLSANKPGANSGVFGWLEVYLNGTVAYIPCWT
jgi:hypothetical protein